MNRIKISLSILFAFITIITNAQEVIPFTLGEDNRIYIKVSFNGSDSLDFVYDLGANCVVINKSKIEARNIQIKFDSLTENVGSHGISQETMSFKNTVAIGKITQEDVQVVGIDYPKEEKLDGVIGWNFFKDKIMKIDYESNELVLYDNNYLVSESYTKHKIKFVNGVPFIKFTLFEGNKKIKILGMIDTGYNGTISIYYTSVYKNKLKDKYQIIGEATSTGSDGNISKSDLVLPLKVSLGNFEIYNMPIVLETTESVSPYEALLGGEILKRFHIVLDFKKNVIYLKPNSKINSSFN